MLHATVISEQVCPDESHGPVRSRAARSVPRRKTATTRVRNHTTKRNGHVLLRLDDSVATRVMP